MLVFIAGVDAIGKSGNVTGNTHHNKLSVITAAPMKRVYGGVFVCVNTHSSHTKREKCLCDS